MKMILAGTAASFLIATVAYFGLNEAGFSSAEVQSAPATVRLPSEE